MSRKYLKFASREPQLKFVAKMNLENPTPTALSNRSPSMSLLPRDSSKTKLPQINMHKPRGSFPVSTPRTQLKKSTSSQNIHNQLFTPRIANSKPLNEATSDNNEAEEEQPDGEDLRMSAQYVQSPQVQKKTSALKLQAQQHKPRVYQHRSPGKFSNYMAIQDRYQEIPVQPKSPKKVKRRSPSPVKIEKEPFKRDLSIFKDFNEDNQASRKECLKRDIKYSKIKQLFKE